MQIFRFPLSRFTLCFVFGIGLQRFFGFSTEYLLGVCTISISLLFLFFLRFQMSRPKQFYFGISIVLTGLSTGALCLASHSDTSKKDHYSSRISQKVQAIRITIVEKLKTTESFERYVCEVERLDNTPVSGKVLLNIRRKRTIYDLPTGLRMITATKLLPHKPPLNPNQFEYGAYLTNRNIYAQTYVDDFIRLDVEKDLFYYCDALRKRILSHLKQSGLPEKESAVFAALLLGQQQDIDPETLHDYQFAGAVHILSVSGLHVGFVLLLLDFLLGYLPRTKQFNLLRLAIVVVGLWGFAAIAGLSPSVIRSVTMFSFVALGMYLKRNTNIFHTLLVSMLLILLFRPQFLFDIGFQLSYLALFFIVWLQPFLSRTWSTENKIATYFKNILTTSFAAQIGTFPLSLFYFHQFPGLFFATNLAVIPMLSVIMTLGIVVCVWAAISKVPFVLIYPMELGIKWLNTIISHLARVEDFVFTDIPFTMPMLIIGYVLIGAFSHWLIQPDFKKLFITLASIFAFQTACVYPMWIAENSRELIVFNNRKSSIIAKRNGREIQLMASDSITVKTFDFVVNPYLTANFSDISKQAKIGNVMTFSGKRIAILDSSGVYAPFATDVVIMTRSPKINLDRALKVLQPKVIIADASNFKTYTKLWERTCRKQKIPFHATAEKGFYKILESP